MLALSLWVLMGTQPQNTLLRVNNQPTPLHGIRLGSPLGRNVQPNSAPTPKRIRTDQAGPSHTLQQTDPADQTSADPVAPLPEPATQFKTEPGWLPADPPELSQTESEANQTGPAATMT